MSEKYVKIQALQAAPYTATNNRIEFIIPQSFGKVSLRDSFIQVYVQATGTTATAGGVPMVALQWSPDGTVGAAVSTYTDNVALVRNARISSSMKGSIESVRRTDVLRQNLNCYVRKSQTQVDSDNYLAVNPMQQLINTQRDSPFQQINKLGTVASQNNNNVPMMVRLGDFLDFCNVEAIDCARTGDVRLNIEMNINRFVARQVKNHFLTNAANVDDIAAPGAGTLDVNSLTSTAKFEHLEEVPYYVGQEIKITANINGAAGTEHTAVIDSITQAADGKVTLNFAATLFTLNAGAGGSTGGVMSIPDAATTSLNWNLAELVVKQLPMNVAAPPSVMYHEFMTYELNANNLTNYTHVVEIDGSTDSAILMPVAANGIVANKANEDIQTYEFSLNNISLSDNRLVELYSSLYLDRFVAAMKSSDYVARSLSNSVYDTAGLQQQGDNAILASPLFQTAARKNLQIQINSTTGLGQYILYCSRPRIMDF